MESADIPLCGFIYLADAAARLGISITQARRLIDGANGNKKWLDGHQDRIHGWVVSAESVNRYSKVRLEKGRERQIVATIPARCLTLSEMVEETGMSQQELITRFMEPSFITADGLVVFPEAILKAIQKGG